ncbi:MAG: hypothetical protein U0990_09635 [Candidatus Nanopelagicales bacterium]|nr:hypothetical protein [Candidatus Nanopelagicales bacterium]
MTDSRIIVGDETMNIDKYMDRVIKHFRSGAADEGDWRIMAEAVLRASEDGDDIRPLDAKLLTAGEFRECYPEE